MSNDLHLLSLSDLGNLLSQKSLSSVELVQSIIQRTKKLNPQLHALLSFDEEQALIEAQKSDERRLQNHSLSPWDGIPFIVKDNISVANHPCSCASKILENFKATYNATAIDKLSQQGMIPFGRANMDEFAMGSSCENSAYGITHNPWDLQRVPGGSSGGCAAAVSARIAPCALGSDTGGSIRQPAAFCGVVGFKPGYGTISRYGLVAYASSLDQIGPFANSVMDCATLYQIMAGPDRFDSTLYQTPPQAIKLNDSTDLKGFKIGIPREYVASAGISNGIKKVFEQTVKNYVDMGAELVDIQLPHAEYAIATYYLIATAEASANLARFDGIRYGQREVSKNLNDLYFKSRGNGFGKEVKRRIILGTYALSSGYYDAYYLRAQKARTLIRQDFTNALSQCDCILSPVTPTVAFKINEKTSDPLQMYLADIFTTSLNLYGGCGISVPAGFDDESKMPVGIQLMGAPQDAQKILQPALALEKYLAQSFIPPIV